MKNQDMMATQETKKSIMQMTGSVLDANKPDKDRSFVYRLTLVASVAQPLMTLPQVVQIYTSHNVSGLSLATWLGYAVIGLVFLAYGIKYKLLPIAITQVIWFVLQISVVVGILLYS